MVAHSGQQAVANARQWTSYPPGYCLKWVRAEAWQIGSLYASAIEAWHGARHQHPGDRTPPLGAPCFYRGGQYGHVVIFTGDGDMRSTDCTTTGRVSEAAISWVENHWGYEYLGWTGDLNGVDLPVGDGNEEDDMPLSEDDLRKIAKRVNMALGDYDAEGDERDNASDPPEYADKRLRQVENTVRRLEEKIDRLLNSG